MTDGLGLATLVLIEQLVGVLELDQLALVGEFPDLRQDPLPEVVRQRVAVQGLEVLGDRPRARSGILIEGRYCLRDHLQDAISDPARTRTEWNEHRLIEASNTRDRLDRLNPWYLDVGWVLPGHCNLSQVARNKKMERNTRGYARAAAAEA